MIKTIIICAIIYALYKTFGKSSEAKHIDRVAAAGNKLMDFQKEVQAKYTQEQWDEACKKLL
jgi:hypothetical protein